MNPAASRTPFQGVWTVLRFNWHFFAGAGAGAAGAPLVSWMFAPEWLPVCGWLAAGAVLALGVSLAATHHAYDRSGLYDFRWLDSWMEGGARSAVTIHAGFDETSPLLQARYPRVAWSVADFYDPSRHTEISIRRARRVFPPHPATLPVSTEKLPFADGAFDRVILFLAAHEIRDRGERAAFFAEVRRVLNDCGRVIVTEHLRDWPNLLAYSAGAFHFHTRRVWLDAFAAAGLRVEKVHRNNLFIHTFILTKI